MVAAAGPLNQNAFIVKNIAEAVAYWTSLGVGPFLQLPPLSFDEGTLHGRPNLPKFTAAIAYSGELMIELIEPAGPSIFQEFLDAGGAGVHHNCVATEDYEASVADLTAKGGVTLQTQTIYGSRMAYIEMPGGLIIEVAELQAPTVALFNSIKQAGYNWDGKTQFMSLG